MTWINTLKNQENKLQKQVGETIVQYDSLAVSLSPMVERILVRLGEALWGKRHFVCNFRFQNYKKHGHQTWRIVKGWFFQSSADHVSVMLSKDMQQFYVCCSDLDHRNCSILDSRKISEQALTEALIKACNKKNWIPQNSV